MPIYDYRCSCGHRVYNVWYSTADKVKRIDCSQCGKPMQNVLSSPSLRFVGDGWMTPKATEDADTTE